MDPDGTAAAAGAAAPFRLYGRRKGRPLRPGRRAQLANQLRRLALPTDGDGPIDPRHVFDPPRPRVWLEIGFGSGEHLIGQARNDDDVGLIGCEPFLNGVAALTAAVIAGGLEERVRVFADDARLLLPRLEPASLERVFVLFPDPWPKRRHHRRRLIQAHTVAAIAGVLRCGGELRFASDDEDYALATLQLLTDHPDFVWAARRADDWRQPPADWVTTRYEMKARAAGRAPLFLRFFRRQRQENPGNG